MPPMSEDLPPIVRARECYLYTIHGTRLLDLYRDEGRALFGHRAPAVLLALKNELSRGLAVEYPGVQTGRVVKAIQALAKRFDLPNGVVHVYRNADAMAASMSARPTRVEVWRPFEPSSSPGAGPDDVASGGGIRALELIVPMPGGWAPRAALYPDGGTAVSVYSDGIASALLAAYARAVHDLVAAAPPASWRDGQEDLTDLWERRGPYLYCRCVEPMYPRVFHAMLEGGILVNPRYPGPSVLPIIWSDGERSRFRTISHTLLSAVPRGEEG